MPSSSWNTFSLLHDYLLNIFQISVKTTCSKQRLLTLIQLRSPCFVDIWQCCAFWSSREEIPHIQGKRNPSKTVCVARGHQRADTLKPYSQKPSQSNYTRTTALSNSVEPSHACGATQDGRVMVERSDNVVHWRREWKTTSVFLP